jgi:hypothetical protein
LCIGGFGLILFIILIGGMPFPSNGLVLLFIPGWVILDTIARKIRGSPDAEALARQAKYWKALEPKLRPARSEDDSTDHV